MTKIYEALENAKIEVFQGDLRFIHPVLALAHLLRNPPKWS